MAGHVGTRGASGCPCGWTRWEISERKKSQNVCKMAEYAAPGDRRLRPGDDLQRHEGIVDVVQDFDESKKFARDNAEVAQLSVGDRAIRIVLGR